MRSSCRAIGAPGPRGARGPDGSDALESRDRHAVLFAAALIGLAAIVGSIMLAFGSRMSLSAPPLFADVHSHVGPGTPVAVVLGWAGWRFGPRLTRQLAWRRLLPI